MTRIFYALLGPKKACSSDFVTPFSEIYVIQVGKKSDILLIFFKRRASLTSVGLGCGGVRWGFTPLKPHIVWGFEVRQGGENFETKIFEFRWF